MFNIGDQVRVNYAQLEYIPSGWHGLVGKIIKHDDRYSRYVIEVKLHPTDINALMGVLPENLIRREPPFDVVHIDLLEGNLIPYP